MSVRVAAAIGFGLGVASSHQQGFRRCTDASTKVRRVDAGDPAIAPLPQPAK